MTGRRFLSQSLFIHLISYKRLVRSAHSAKSRPGGRSYTRLVDGRRAGSRDLEIAPTDFNVAQNMNIGVHLLVTTARNAAAHQG